MDITKSPFFVKGSISDMLKKAWIADDVLQEKPTTNVQVLDRIVNKVKTLQYTSNLPKGYNEVRVASTDSSVDYEFDNQVFDTINEYLTNRKINRNRRICGLIRLYVTGFIEEFRDKLHRPDDLLEKRPDDQAPKNIFDDINEEIDQFQFNLLKAFEKSIQTYPELTDKELEIQLIGTSHQLDYFSNRLRKIVKDTDRYNKIITEVVGIRNRFILSREKNATREFLEKHPYYITSSYYSSHQSEFSDDLFSRFPSQCAIAIQSNNYSSCIIS